MSLEILEVKNMIRHLHNDIENVKRSVAKLDHKVTGLAYLTSDASLLVVSKEAVENVVNPDSETYNVDELYSPIDEKDREEWEKIKQERKFTKYRDLQNTENQENE